MATEDSEQLTGSPCSNVLIVLISHQEVEIESIRRMLARVADTGHSNQHNAWGSKILLNVRGAVLVLVVRQ